MIVAEVVGEFAPLYPAVTNAELATAFGADLPTMKHFFDRGVLQNEGTAPC